MVENGTFWVHGSRIGTGHLGESDYSAALETLPRGRDLVQPSFDEETCEALSQDAYAFFRAGRGESAGDRVSAGDRGGAGTVS